MLIRRRRGWEIPDGRVTPEYLVIGRRTLVEGAGRAIAGGALAALVAGPARRAWAATNPAYPPGRAITPESDSTTYNNYYEFGDDKSISRAAQRLPVSPWQVEIAGMVAKPRKMDISDLLKQVEIEERVCTGIAALKHGR